MAAKFDQEQLFLQKEQISEQNKIIYHRTEEIGRFEQEMLEKDSIIKHLTNDLDI